MLAVRGKLENAVMSTPGITAAARSASGIATPELLSLGARVMGRFLAGELLLDSDLCSRPTPPDRRRSTGPDERHDNGPPESAVALEAD